MQDKEVLTFKTVTIPYDDSAVIRFLYKTIPGRAILNLITRTPVSKFVGMIMDSAVSCLLIPGFIKNNNIDMEEYEPVKYRSFNEFFERKIKPERRSFKDSPGEIVAPSDGKLTAYTITTDSAFYVKRSKYSLADLLQDEKLAAEYMGGVCLIYRLEPTDYHRYAFIDDGEIVAHKKINGVLHTVRPILDCKYNVFARNAREYVLLETKNTGKIIQMEVGALFVGKIVNYKSSGSVERAEEKGLFRFGGSTVIMFFPKDTLDVHAQIFENTQRDEETLVKMGDSIGTNKIPPTV